MERKSFDELYRDILQQKIDLREPLPPEYDPLHLDCLLHPKNYAPDFQTTQFQNCEEEIKRKCIQSCLFEAIKEEENGKVSINTEKMYRVRWMHSFLQTGKIAGKPRSAGSDDGAAEEKGGSIYIGGACVYGAVRKRGHSGKIAECISDPRI